MPAPKPAGYWSKQRCMELAALCSTKMEFHRRHKGAYLASSKGGWLDDVCAHMPSRSFGVYKWTDQRIEAEVAKHTDFADFRRSNQSLFVILSSTGRLDKFTGHLARDRNANGHWTKERCAECLNECVTRTDFQKRFPGAYDAAHKNGWLDEICQNLAVIGNHKRRAVYVIKAIGDKTVYVGLSAHTRRRYAVHHSRGGRSVRWLLSKPHRFKTITDYIPVKDAANLERRLIKHFQDKGWNVINRSAGGQTGCMPTKWTKTALADLARTMATRGQMMREHVGAYGAAIDFGILDEIFAGHISRGFGDGPIRDWSADAITRIAKQYSTSSQFKASDRKAWAAANRRGLLRSIYSNSKSRRN